MNPRTIKEIMAEALSEVKRLQQEKVEIEVKTEDEAQIKYLLEIDSDLSFDSLINLLTIALNHNSWNESNTLTIFRNNYARRWSLIRKSDCEYNVTPNSSVNKAWLFVAQQLAPLEGKHAYDWLMPDVKFNDAKTSDGKSCYEHALQEFFIGPDNVPVMLDMCFEYIEANPPNNALIKKRRSTKLIPPKQTKNENEEDHPVLSSVKLEDQSFAGRHSDLARKYYAEIPDGESLHEAKEKFKTSIQSDDYPITATYQKPGIKILFSSLLKDVNTLVGMAEFLYKHVPKNYWQNFLNISDDVVFKKVLNFDLPALRLQHKDYFGAHLCNAASQLLKTWAEKPYSFDNPEELRALMVCWLHIYSVSRGKGPVYKTNTGWFGSFFSTWAQPKDNRLHASVMLMNFLLSDHPLNDLKGYLLKNDCKELIASLIDGANDGSTLYKLTHFLTAEAAKLAQVSESKLTFV